MFCLLTYLQKQYCLVCTDNIELQPLNGQGQSGDSEAAKHATSSADAIDVVVLDGKQKHPG